MEKDLQTKEAKELYKALLLLTNEKEVKQFLRDLCTRKELESMIERFTVVKLVDKHVSYREIAKKTGSSTATITRVAQWLHHGVGGYRLMLDRLHR